MTVACSCNDSTLGNMGMPGCAPIHRIARRLIFLPYFKADGTVNKIDLTATLDDDFFTDHFQEYDSADALVTSDQRWYLTPDLENVENLRAETVFQESNAGRKFKVREGTRTFTGFIMDNLGGVPEMLAKVRRFRCAKIGVYIVDANGNIRGNGGTDGELRPFAVDKTSFDPQYIEQTDSEAPMVRITFDFGRLEDDADMKMIVASADFPGIDLLSYPGLLDMYGKTSGAIATTGFTIDIYTSYGSAKTPVPISGLVAADFAAYNVTDASAITIASLTESLTVEGRYTVTYTAQTSADVIRLTPNKKGFDGSAVAALVITTA